MRIAGKPQDSAFLTRITNWGRLMLGWLLLMALVLVFHSYLESRLKQREERIWQSAVSDRLSVMRYQLESTLSSTLSLINGLAAFIASYPDFSDEQFQLYAKTVVDREPTLLSLVAAPDLVVRYLYPLAGNEEVLGLDYRQTPGQRESVLNAVEQRQMVVDGPVELVQGGVGLVGRMPVLVDVEGGEPQVWGIVASAIRVESVYDAAGLAEIQQLARLAIRETDSQDTFYGAGDVFEDPMAIIMPVSAANLQWEFAAVPSEQMYQGANVWILRICSFAVFVGLAALLFFRHRQELQNARLREIIFSNEQFLRAVEQVSHVGGWRWNGRVFSDMSVHARQILNIPVNHDTVTMSEFTHTLSAPSRQAVSDYIEIAFQNRERLDCEIEVHRVEGDSIWLHIKAAINQSDQQAPELIGAIQNITQQKKADQIIEFQANYDQLTRLPNRALFLDRLQHALLNVQRDQKRIAVLFFDLDNFKSVNDNLGHDAGDELLVETGHRIQACMRATDTVARHSGDEFVAMLTDVGSAVVVSRIADDIVASMRQPFFLDGHSVHCNISVGIAFSPDDGTDVDTLVIKADQAMYEVKKSGRNGWQFYTQVMQKESEEKHKLFNDLVVAIGQNQLKVYYQPVVRASDGQVVSCEALVRWPSNDGGLISTDQFISVAEERGLVNRIDLFVLRNSLAFIERLNQELGTQVHLSVNVSPRLLHLRDEDAKAWLDTLRQRNEVDLTIEITERVLVEDSDNTHQVLHELDLAGIRIAIDDFGTGYSGLSYFSRFPVSVVKIDRSFVQGLTTSETETTLVETILLLANKLGVQVIAEGVEKESQAAFLRANHCDMLQGYHIAPPMPEKEFLEFVRRNRISTVENH